MSWSKDDFEYMSQALLLAKKGEYTARPNPMVGCVMVKNGQIVGQGWHQKFGQAHAEINALKDAGTKAKGATCYVTLEPCSFTGKTGPCAKALINAGVVSVVAAMQDPNPMVRGKGFEILEKAGIQTKCGLLEQQALKLNKGFISRFEKNKPWVSLKLAMSLDGRTALADGSSQWITGKAARLDVQKLRARQDAIITGVGTLLADNPSLTVRGDDQQGWFSQLNQFQQPVRILLDRMAKASLNEKLFNNNAPVLWMSSNINAEKKLAQSSCSNVKVVKKETVKELIEFCVTQGMNHILVEAGHKLAGQFLQHRMVDEIILYIAPKLMGNQAMGLFELNVLQMTDCPKLTLQSIRQFGDDLRLVYYPQYID